MPLSNSAATSNTMAIRTGLASGWSRAARFTSSAACQANSVPPNPSNGVVERYTQMRWN